MVSVASLASVASLGNCLTFRATNLNDFLCREGYLPHTGENARFPTYDLFKQRRSGMEEAEVDLAMNEWCKGIDSLAKKKRIWLHAANLSFVFAFAITLAILALFAIAMRTGKI